MTYVDLQLNPERYTGYTGPSARRIWDAIYLENCHNCTSIFIEPEDCWEQELILESDIFYITS